MTDWRDDPDHPLTKELRKQPKSAVAGILSPDGGLRFLIAQRWRMRSYLEPGERLFVVPNFWVQEPVPWAMTGHIVRRVTEHVLKRVAPQNPCGECRACCITLYIRDPGFRFGDQRAADGSFEKPSHTVCANCDAKLGCRQQYHKPMPCRTFQCLWLKSQRTNRIMGPELRPDRCGVILTDREESDPDWVSFQIHPMRRDHAPEADVEPMERWLAVAKSEGEFGKLVTYYYGEGDG